ncbi:MAG: DNA internalization-related competence protein ComEC/Rec2 [Desulfobulbaceae bacterium]|nr:DNA internalization-related competence protein ComEC/Rec2 [Desulfobulbaceae bacterium]
MNPPFQVKILFHPGYLIIQAALSLMSGIGYALAFPTSSGPVLLAASISSGILSLLLRRQKKGHILLLLFVFFMGATLGVHRQKIPPAPHIRSLITQPALTTCTGVISETLSRNGERIKIKIAIDTIYTPSAQNSTSHRMMDNLFITKTHGTIQVSMPFFEHGHLNPGDRITFKAKLSPPRGFANPGGFDFPVFLQSHNIFITGWIAQPDTIIKHNPEKKTATRLSGYFTENIRADLIRFYETNLSITHGSLYKALITGDRSGLSNETQEMFKNLGIIHLLAISGLHMGLLAGFTMWFSTKFLSLFPRLLLYVPAQQGAAALAMIPVIFYCFISGLHPPAVRACLMTVVLFSGFILRRKWHGPTAIGAAALILLIGNPLLLTMVSFQLSFVAVTAIVLILPIIKQRFFTPNHALSWLGLMQRTILSGLYISLIASLATLPLLLYHFNRVSLVSPVTTLIMEPLLCLWALGFGLAGSALSVFAPTPATILLKVGTLGFDCSLWLGNLINTIPNLTLWLPAPEGWKMILFYSGLIFFLIFRNRASVSVVIVTLILLLIPFRQHPEYDHVTMIDVGKGNSSLIECASGETILIDCGGPNSTTFNIGRQVIGPFLFHRKIREVDLLILSHSDNDHYSGAPFLIDHFNPKEIWIPYEYADNPQWNAMLKKANDQGVKIRIPKENESYPLQNGRTLRNLSNAHRMEPHWSQNNQSLVIRFTSGPYSFLFPGDIEELSEENLLHTQKDLQSTVIVAPHHGSKSSSTPAFINRVMPQYVVFSASQYGRTTFPAPTIVTRYTDRNSIPLKTADKGGITFTPRDNTLHVATTLP